jgi:hypothetical protein
MSVFFAEVAHVGTGCFEDPQSEQTQHCDQGEVEPVRGLARGGQHRLKLQVCQSECGRLGWDGWPADVLRRGVRKDAVDDGGAVEPAEY